MNKNLIYRILGIVACIILIGSLFLPFTNYEGFTSTLFENAYDQNYVPYILIAFSFLSIIVFLLNKKIELAYITVGSSLTIAIVYSFMYHDSFEFLSFGYYLLVFSPIVLLVSILLQSKGESEIVTYSSNFNKDISNNQQVVDNELNKLNSLNSVNNEPNRLAQSIMDQPVMRNLSVEDNNAQNGDVQIDLNNSLNNNDSENVTLAPQNPLNQFLSPSVNTNQVPVNNVTGLQSDSTTQVQNENLFENNEVKESDSSQSILSIMNQPMVSSQTLNSVNSQPVQLQNTANVSSLGAQSLASMTGEKVINHEPLNQTIESATPVQPVGQVVEPTTPVQPITEVQPVGQVVEPTTPVQPVTEVQPVGQVVESATPVQSVTEVQPVGQVVEPAIPVQPITEVQPVGQVVEPATPVQPVTEVQPVGQVVEPTTPVQPITEVQPVGQVVEPTTPVQPVTEVQPVGQVVEPTTPVQPITEVQPVSQVVEPTIPDSLIPDIQQGMPEVQSQSIPPIPEQNNNSVFEQGPIKFE